MLIAPILCGGQTAIQWQHLSGMLFAIGSLPNAPSNKALQGYICSELMHRHFLEIRSALTQMKTSVGSRAPLATLTDFFPCASIVSVVIFRPLSPDGSIVR